MRCELSPRTDCTTRKLSVDVTHTLVLADRHFENAAAQQPRLTHGVWWHTPTLSHSDKHRSKQGEPRLFILQHSPGPRLVNLDVGCSGIWSVCFLFSNLTLWLKFCCFLGRKSQNFDILRTVFVTINPFSFFRHALGVYSRTIRPHLANKSQWWWRPSLLTLWSWTAHRHLFVSHVQFTPSVRWSSCRSAHVKFKNVLKNENSQHLLTEKRRLKNIRYVGQAPVHLPSWITPSITACCHFLCLREANHILTLQPSISAALLRNHNTATRRGGKNTQSWIWTDVGFKRACHMCTCRM